MNITRQQLLGHVFDVVSQLNPVGPLAESTPIDVVIALPAQNVEERTALLRDIYDPASPRFHQFLSPLEYTQRFDPTEASYQSLLDFVKANQLTVVSTAPPKFIHVTASAAVINQMFHVTLQQYPHPTEDRHFYAPDVDPAVTLETPGLQITGLDNFQTPRRAPNLLKSPGKLSGSPLQASGSGDNGLYTGGDFRAAYAPGVALTGKGQAVGILELDGYVESDIRMYEQKNGIPNVPLQNVYLDGYTGGNPNEESAGDIELVISMAPGLAQVTIYGVPYNNPGIIDVLHEMANPTRGEPLPSQITTSYYFFYDKNVYDALARLAVQGQALFVASGDFGSYNEKTGSGAFPPADHPLVTSVGGTELVTSGPGGAWTSETTASFSGGGYSPWGVDPQFAIPWWQAGMDYTACKGSTTVRNAPDVSIVADNISVFSNGSWRPFAGTSAAAPLWAGFMALANEQAAALGKPHVGFANPVLWAIGRGGNCPTCFHDITIGNNFNSTNPNLYSAVAGYDLCTGWGTPNGQDLIDALVRYSVGELRRTWSIIVPGSFGGSTGFTDLFFYDPTEGGGDLISIINGQGDLRLIRRYAVGELRKTWSIIVPGNFGGGTGFTDLFFYDPTEGGGDLISIINGQGDLRLIRRYAANELRKTWSIIVPGNFGGGTGFTDLFFYDPTEGGGDLISIINGQGDLRLIRRYAVGELRKTWSIIVPGNFGGGTGFTDLFFYDPTEGGGDLISIINGQGDLRLIRRYAANELRKTWSIIVPGNFGGGTGFTDLFFYDPTEGGGDLISIINGQGDLRLIRRYAANELRKTWSIIVPGNFGGGTGFTDLFFYDPTEGGGDLISIINGQGDLRLIRRY